MKKALFLFVMIFTVTVYCVDYSKLSNWVFCENGKPTKEQLFDVFYVFPTLTLNTDKMVMDWSKPEVVKKVAAHSESQAKIWGKQARVFVPFVRQLDFKYCVPELKSGKPWEDTKFKHGIQDAAEAFDYYMKHYNNGRPFIIFGHSQGSMDLYCLVKNNKSISAGNGMVAAYLIGVPMVTEKRFSKDFANRDVKPAKKADDLGVVVIWNTESPSASNSVFTGPGTICINPLNWNTDSTPASAKENKCAVLKDRKTGKFTRAPFFCGAYINTKIGALIPDLPAKNSYIKSSPLGNNLYHGDDVYFFAENLRLNALLRVEKWLKTYAANKK